jgi:dihydroorotase
MTDHDLVIAGGTVIDPASGFHGRRDLAIDGRIAAIAPSLGTAAARDVIDATGLLVVPDWSTPRPRLWGVADLSVEADPTCLGRRVTTAVDAGSSGANTFPGFRRYVVDGSRGRILAYLNISAAGQVDPRSASLLDLRFVDPERAAAVALANPDLVVGSRCACRLLAGPNSSSRSAARRPVGRRTCRSWSIGGTAFDIEECWGASGPATS